MALADGLPIAYQVVKGAIDIGIGLHSMYKAYRNKTQKTLDSVQRGVSFLGAEVTQIGKEVGHLRGDMKVVRQGIQKVLDNQASLLALFAEGAGEICARLDELQLQVNRGFNAVIQTVKDEAAIRDAREFKMRLGLATAACNRILEDIVVAAESRDKRFPACASRDMEKAESAATELYQWANSFVPDSSGEMTKQAKLQVMPYIVAMAYAAQIQIITQFMERDMADRESDKAIYVNRARDIVSDFIETLTSVLEGLMAGTSLLEIALDYQMPMAAYLTLMTSFRGSVDELLTPSAKEKDITIWDDGLSLIREVLIWKSNDDNDQEEERTIKLKGIKESVWWAAFTNTDLENTDVREMKTSIDVRDLCHALGAADDEYIASIALNPGKKSTLTQLPPVSDLRATLCAKISEVRKAAEGVCPPPLPESFACINAAPKDLSGLVTALESYLQLAAALEGSSYSVDEPEELVISDPIALVGHTGAVMSVVVCSDSERVVSGSLDETARVWSLRSGDLLAGFPLHNDDINCVAASPDDEWAVSAGDDKILFGWNVDSGLPRFKLQGHAGIVLAVAVSPDGNIIASGSSDKKIELWNISTKENAGTLTGHSQYVWCLAFSPDGRRLVSGSGDKSIKVWNMNTRALERTIRGHSDVVRSVVVAPNSRWLVSCSDDETVKVWNLSNGAKEMVFTEHFRGVNCVAVFPDGQRIVSGSDDLSIRVWNLNTREREVMIVGHTSPVRCIAVSPDGRSLVSGSNDGLIKVWPMSGGGGGGGGGGGSSSSRLAALLGLAD